MKKLLFFLFLIFGYGPTLQAQSIPPILERAAAEDKELIIYTLSTSPLLPIADLPGNFSHAGQSFVKNGNHLLLLPQGTGRVYELKGKPGQRTWQRLDSTYYTGYNFGSFPFILDTKLYSFGGSGLWHTNGNLRFFNPASKEWDTKVLSESIPWAQNTVEYTFLYFDTADKKLIVKAGGILENNSVKNPRDSVHQQNIYQLDITSGNWTKIGNAKDTVFFTHATLPWGLLSSMKTVIDVKHNRYLRLHEDITNKIMGVMAGSTKKNEHFISFAIDSTFFLGNMTDPYDSITISYTDLVDTGVPVYSPVNSSSPIAEIDIHTILIVLLSMTCITLAFFYWKKIKPQPLIASVAPSDLHPPAVAKPDTEPEKSVSFRSTRILDLLEEREKSLLEFLYNHSVDERLTTIEEINRVIGVANRSNEIQKRMRSDLIGSINQKLNIITKDKKPVIDKQRSEFDKRSFEYFIQPVHMTLVEKVLGKK